MFPDREAGREANGDGCIDKGDDDDEASRCKPFRLSVLTCLMKEMERGPNIVAELWYGSSVVR